MFDVNIPYHYNFTLGSVLQTKRVRRWTNKAVCTYKSLLEGQKAKAWRTDLPTDGWTSALIDLSLSLSLTVLKMWSFHTINHRGTLHYIAVSRYHSQKNRHHELASSAACSKCDWHYFYLIAILTWERSREVVGLARESVRLGVWQQLLCGCTVFQSSQLSER